MTTAIGPRVIVALDFATEAEAMAMADRLDPGKCAVKVGKELFTAQKFLNAMVFDHSQRNLKDTSQLRKVRIYKAQIHTYMSERPIPVVTEAPAKKPTKKEH